MTSSNIIHFRLSQYQEDMKRSVLVKAEKLEGEGWERYLDS